MVMASTNQTELVNSVGYFKKECDRVFEAFKSKKSQALPAWLEFEDTVEPQRIPWKAIRMRIERWRVKQLSGSSFRPKVDDALEVLEPFASSLVKGESLLLPKSLANRSADLLI